MESTTPAKGHIVDGHWQSNLNNSYLAPREVAYCIGLLSGKTDKVIAREQGVEPSSVSNRIKNVHYKLNTNNRAHLVAELIRLKIITPLLIVFSVTAVPEWPRVMQEDPNKPRPVRVAQRSIRRQESFNTSRV